MNNIFVTFLFILICRIFPVEAASIKGEIWLDESWEPVIYLSLINSFDDLNTASYDFLIDAATIDSIGYFEMNAVKIPSGNRIYRLHVCKKGDPVSTIIIGGNDENFIHFIMNEESDITLSSLDKYSRIHQSTIKGNPANASLNELFKLQKDLQTPPALPSKQNREILKKRIIKHYEQISDTSSLSIIKLLAVYFINESSDKPNLEFMEKTLHSLKLSDSSSPYYTVFRDELNYLQYQSAKIEFSTPAWIKWAGLFALIVFIAFAYWMRLRKKIKLKPNTKKDLISSLSIQEKRVFELLKTGASNKEISAELNIEVSTVKSHVYKIYSRLGIKSRKEIINKTW